jgi:uncharacterized protein (TIGR03437 family)
LVLSSAANLAATPVITIGGGTAAVQFAGLSAAGLDQINVTIPALHAGSAGTIDLPISAKAGASSTQPGLLVTVQSGN